MKKCETCRHYGTVEIPHANRRQGPHGVYFDFACVTTRTIETCGQSNILLTAQRGVEVHLDQAREICNKEGDGIFVYFEPLDEAPGGATFVQITCNRKPKAMGASA